MAKVKIKTAAAARLEGCNPQASQEFAEGAGHSQSRHGRIRKPVNRLTTETTDDGLFYKEVTNFMVEVKEHDKANVQLYAVMLTQLSLKAGIKEQGEEAAAMKGMSQFHKKTVMRPANTNESTCEEQVKAMSSLTFLKQK